MFGLEAIWRDGQVVGHVRRADFGFAIDKTVAYGYIRDPSGGPVSPGLRPPRGRAPMSKDLASAPTLAGCRGRCLRIRGAECRSRGSPVLRRVSAAGRAGPQGRRRAGTPRPSKVPCASPAPVPPGLPGLREAWGLQPGEDGGGLPCPGSPEVPLRPRQQEGEGGLLRGRETRPPPPRTPPPRTPPGPAAPWGPARDPGRSFGPPTHPPRMRTERWRDPKGPSCGH